MSYIAARVRRYREISDLSQAELAARAGVNRSTITRIESGDTVDPPTSLIERIAHALGVPVREFFPALAALDGPPLADRRATGRTAERGRKALRAAMPIFVKRASFQAAAAGGPDHLDGADTWTYSPRAGEESHEFVLVTVTGTSMEPEFEDGDELFVDLSEPVLVGDRIVVAQGKAALVKILAEDEHGQWLESHRGRRLRLTPNTVVVGVVKERRARVQRGARQPGRPLRRQTAPGGAS